MEKKNPLLIKKHWHLIVWEVPVVGLPQKISTYAATRKQLASIPEIRAAQQERQVPQGAVLVGINYLGFGSQCDLTGEHPEPLPTHVTDMYLTGLEVALHAPDPTAVTNPYDNEQHNVHMAQEWQLGFSQGVKLRNSRGLAVL